MYEDVKKADLHCSKQSSDAHGSDRVGIAKAIADLEDEIKKSKKILEESQKCRRDIYREEALSKGKTGQSSQIGSL